MSASPAARQLADADYERLAEFRYLLRQFMIFSEDAAGQAGLTAQQHQALLAIKGFGRDKPLTTGELAERLGVRHHSAVGLIDRLLSKSLVKRQSGAEDRRQVLLTLGFAFVLDDMALVIWGGDSFTVPIPQMLKGGMHVFGVYYPTYRLFVLATGIVVFAGLWLLLNHTRLGALIRAGVDDAVVRHPWWPDALRLRRYDDAAKDPTATGASVDDVLAVAARVLHRRSTA